MRNIWEYAIEELHPLQVTKDGHRTGTIHSEKVDLNIYKILSPRLKEFKNYKELFILSTTACLHDIGKREGVNYDHGLESFRLIDENHTDYKLEDKGFADIVAKISAAHHNDDFFEELEDEIIITQKFNLKQLASIFRLADALDSDYTRVEKEKIESEKDRFRHIIHGWELNETEERLVDIHAKLENDENIELMNTGFSMMQEQLDCAIPYLLELKLPTELNLIAEYKKELKSIIDNEIPSKNFVGLNSLSENNILIGRDREANQLCRIAITSRHHISLLTGYSGVGKTSLVQAGLSSKMKYMKSFKKLLIPIYEDPINNMIVNINLSLLKRINFNVNNLDNSIKDLSSSFEKILLILDQFERILDLPIKKLDQLKKLLQSIYLKRFRNIYLLIVYKKESDVDILEFLYDSIGTKWFPKIVLRALDKKDVRDIFREGFSAERKALDKETTLLRRIVNDLITESNHICPDKIFPPFIQIVGMELVKYAKNDIITIELYEQLGRANNIINNFLLTQLDSFEPHLKKFAEEFLKKLVFNGKKVSPIHKNNLIKYLDIDKKNFNKLINLLDKNRLIRISGDFIELIHDYLAERIETELVRPIEKQFRNAIYSFKVKSENFEITNEYLNSFEMVVLYSGREKFQKELEFNGIKKRKFLFQNILSGKGPGWWWFKDIDKEELSFLVFDTLKCSSSIDKIIIDNTLEIFRNYYSHDNLLKLKGMLKNDDFEVRRAAFDAIAKFSSKEDLPQLREMLKDDSYKVRRVAVNAIAKLGSKEDLPHLREMLKDNNYKVRRVAVNVIMGLGFKEDLPLLRKRLKDDGYKVRRAAVNAIAKLGSKEDLLQLKEMLKDDDSYVRFNAVKAIIKLGSKEDLLQLKEMLKDDDYNVRRAAINAIAKFGSKEDLPLLRKRLKDDNFNVRRAAVNTIAKLGSKLDLPQLEAVLKELLKDDDSYVRRAAVNAITKLGSKEDLLLVRKTLKDDDSYVRKAAVNAITKLGSKEDLPQLKEMLKDNDFWVRSATVDAITKLISKLDLPQLKKILKDNYPEVRSAAIAAINKLVFKKDLPQLKKMLKDDVSYVRSAAVYTITNLGSKKDLPQLKEMLKDDDSYVRLNTVIGIAKFGSKKDLPQLEAMLKELLKDDDSYVRFNAVNIITKLGSKEDLLLVRKTLKDDDSEVRKAAVNAITKLGSKEDLPQLKEMLKDNDFWVRSATVDAITKLISKLDLLQLREMLKDDYFKVRRVVVKTITKLGSKEDLPQLKEMLKDDDYDVRRAAINAIAKFGSKEDLPLLRKRLKDGNFNVRRVAVNTIAKLGSKEDLPLLRKRLKDKNWDVISAAINAFFMLVSKEDLPQLKEMLKDDNSEVRRAAIKAIAMLGSKEDLPLLRKRLKDGDYNVRRSAVNAIAKLGSKEDLLQLVKILKDYNFVEKRAAAKAIAKLGSKEDLKDILISLNSQVCKGPNILRDQLDSIKLLDEKLYFPFKKEIKNLFV